MLQCKDDEGHFQGMGGLQQCQSPLDEGAGAENLPSWLVWSATKLPRYGVTYFLETGTFSGTWVALKEKSKMMVGLYLSWLG